MPTNTYIAFSPSDISFLSGSQLRIDPLYNSGDAYSFEITDEDPHWSGDAHTIWSSDDPTQQMTTVRDGDGSVVASGRSYLEEGYTLTDEYGETVTIYQVMIDGTAVGYVADGPLQPGNTYTYSTSDVTPSTQSEYANLESQSYDPDATNYISGTGNGDSLQGGAANDSVQAGAGNDTVDGGSGDDTIYGGEGDDSLRGWSGNDFVDGGAGNDTLEGDEGDDTILGGDGDDFISLWGGADSVDGGAGSDTIQINDNFGNDTIIGGEGGTDDDTLDMSNLSGPVTLDYWGHETGAITDGTDTVSFSKIETIILTDSGDYVEAGFTNSGITVDLGGGQRHPLWFRR